MPPHVFTFCYFAISHLSVLFVMAASPLAVTATCVLQSQQGKFSLFQKTEVLIDCFSRRSVNADAPGIEPGNRPCTYTSDHDGIYCSTAYRLDRVACTVNMVQVSIVNRADFSCLGVDHDEYGGRAKMAINRTFDSIILLYGKTYFHLSSSS